MRHINLFGAAVMTALSVEAGIADQVAGGNLARLRQTPSYQAAVISAAYKIEHVAVAGCARPWRVNVLVRVVSPGSLATIALLPGSTHADPVLQRDATLYAVAAAAADPKGCKPIYIADTAFLAADAGRPAIEGKPAWSERWSVMQCKTRTDVEMRFIPDATGTTIAAHRAKGPV